MNILVITPYLPMADRGSGELRLTRLLSLLAEHHRVFLYTWETRPAIPADEVARHERTWQERGVRLLTGGLRRVVRERSFEVVMFEWYYWVDWYLPDIRTWQPRARIVIDTVDLEFRRLLLKARVSGHPEDLRRAETSRSAELAAYAQADLLIAVTDEERDILAAVLPGCPVDVIPNAHRFANELPPLADDPVIVFVGNFRFDPNVDAVGYFCRSILPRVQERVPGARLFIVGDAPPPDVRALAGPRVQVTGYVPDVGVYLGRSRVSVAPLRYGAGMKGKVSEAMASGVPVVTTSVGAQGIALTPGQDVLVADSADEFAAAVVRLLTDRALSETLRRRAWEHAREHWSEDAMRRRLETVCARLATSTPTASAFRVVWRRRASDWVDRHIRWRLHAAARGVGRS